MLNRIKEFGPIFIIITALLWSLDGILRISLYTLPPTIVVFYEHVLGMIVLLPFITVWFKDLKKMTRKEWIAIILVSLFSGALGTILYTSALGKVNYIQYSVVVLLQQQLQPIWAIGTATILLREKITKKFILWACVALVAIYFVTFKDLHINLVQGNGTIIAGLMALTAGFMWGTSTAISKYVLKKVSFVTGTALRFYLTPVFAFFIILITRQTHTLFTLNSTQWITLLIITFSTGLVAVLFYYYGLKRTPARVSTICELVFPGTAIFIDYFYYHKPLSTTQIFGVLLLIFAIYKVTSFKK